MSTHQHRRLHEAASATAATATDPVCGMAVDPAATPQHARYVTPSPSPFSTGTGSPVSIDSSTADAPSITVSVIGNALRLRALSLETPG